MPRTRIPDAIKARVAERIAAFNRQALRDPNAFSQPRYQGPSLYLDLGRDDYGHLSRICRPQDTGALDDGAFALYKDNTATSAMAPPEWLFPGAERVDGTLEGAMRAGLGLAAYPLTQEPARDDAAQPLKLAKTRDFVTTTKARSKDWRSSIRPRAASQTASDRHSADGSSGQRGCKLDRDAAPPR